jgi:hypothetical protein
MGAVAVGLTFLLPVVHRRTGFDIEPPLESDTRPTS